APDGNRAMGNQCSTTCTGRPATGQPWACRAGTPRFRWPAHRYPLMQSPKRAALLWSGGKDSALALYQARKDFPDLRVVKLVTCLSEAYDRVSMHGVRRQLIATQADALGLPVDWVVIPH